MIEPFIMQIVPLFDSVIAITSVDYAKSEGTFKFFDSLKSARLWSHDQSRKLEPELHLRSCRYCKTGVFE